jgi:hypothetical protein
MNDTLPVPADSSDSAPAAVLPVVGDADNSNPKLQDFATALDADAAFTGLSLSDAKNVAAAIAFDLTQRANPGEFLNRRARSVLRGDNGDEWDDPHRVYRALTIAARLVAARMSGV